MSNYILNPQLPELNEGNKIALKTLKTYQITHDISDQRSLEKWDFFQFNK